MSAILNFFVNAIAPRHRTRMYFKEWISAAYYPRNMFQDAVNVADVERRMQDFHALLRSFDT